MVPDVVNLGFVAAYLFLLVLLAVRYRRGSVSGERLLLALGACLTWLAYGLLQITQDGLIPTGTPLDYALDALAVITLPAGLFLLYRWWATRGGDDAERTPAGQ